MKGADGQIQLDVPSFGSSVSTSVERGTHTTLCGKAGVRESLEDAGRWGPREVAKDGIVRFVPNQGWRLAYSACIER